MTEDFLHYLWKFQRFKKSRLSTTQGDAVEIIHQGFHNHNAGPDFGEARIKIGDQLWAGQVEIHIESADWYKHGHQHDEVYTKAVILHVVYKHNKEVLREGGEIIPTLELSGLFDEYLYWRYEQLVQNKDFIPCAGQVRKVDDFIKTQVLERVLVERLERKTQVINEILKFNQGDWDTTLYHWMACGFGLKVNVEPMLQLARSVDWRITQKLKDNELALEAIFLGNAGLLEKAEEDDYMKSLKLEYNHYSLKYSLQPLNSSVFKYSRLRPPAFADFRIALFAAFCRSGNLGLSKILGSGTLSDLQAVFRNSANEYWKEHYRCGKATKAHKPELGEGSISIMIINVVVPFLYLYGQKKGENFYKQRALDLLDQVDPEQNRITSGFKTLNFTNISAFESQAILELYRAYCTPKKCLNCGIGNQLLKD